MTKIQKVVESKKDFVLISILNRYLKFLFEGFQLKIDGEPVICMNREGVEEIWTLIKRQNKTKQTNGKKTENICFT